MKVPVELRRAYRLINHRPVSLVTSAHGGRRNVMAAAWVTPLGLDPPTVSAVLGADSFTRELVRGSGTFALSIPTRTLLDATWAVGQETGRAVDKFAKHRLATFPGQEVDVPLVEGCCAWLECRVVPEDGFAERYDLLVGQVVAAWADDRLYRDGEWRFERDEDRTLHHQTRGVFFLTGERVVAAGATPR